MAEASLPPFGQNICYRFKIIPRVATAPADSATIRDALARDDSVIRGAMVVVTYDRPNEPMDQPGAPIRTPHRPAS